MHADIRWFSEIGLSDVALVGGKNASLGELVRSLAHLGVRVPDGFATTAGAFREFLRASDLDRAIARLLDGLDVQDVEDLQRRGRAIRRAILDAPFPVSLEEGIREAYERLSDGLPGGVDVAVRSSATAEDLPDSSFAGQQESYLGIHGASEVVHACKRCIASLFTDRAISYRVDRGFDHQDVALSVGVQRMVRSDLASAGVAFTLDPESGFPNVVVLNAAFGLGETVVKGTVNPDEYVIFKPTLATGHRPIVRKMLGSKEFKLVYDVGGGRNTRVVPVPAADRGRFALSEEDILQLARWACRIEEHYGARRGEPTPMDIEWAKDGRSGELFIVQARPETVHARKSRQVLETWRLLETGTILATGRGVGEKIATGKVRHIRGPAEMDRFLPGEILLAERTDPDWEPLMKKAAAIVTDRGGRTCHAAIVSRELGVPAVVGTSNGTRVLSDGADVTVSCAEGDSGKVYEGALPFTVETLDLDTVPHPSTRILLNIGNPDEAFHLASLPVDGVGLARLEFILATWVRVHPMALLAWPDISDRAAREAIERLTAGYEDKAAYFVDRLAEGIATIACAFHPRPVIVRLSDFKSNEYAHLLGGEPFEPREENPMLGWRGASRYYDPAFRAAFALECKAFRKARHDMGLANVKIMVPFCRTVEEGRNVQAEMARYGLVRGQDGLEIYVMCEIPSNVLCAREFAAIFDGFSIGSNDLTQLILGCDRDSERIAHLFNEEDPAVKRMIAEAIRAVHASGRPIGICGQAPSDSLSFAHFLVSEGIDSISLNPDAVLKTMVSISEMEPASIGERREDPGM